MLKRGRSRGGDSKAGRIRYRYRLVIGMLVVLVPVLMASQWVLTLQSSSSLTDASHEKMEELALSVEFRLEDWVAERQEGVAVLADQFDGAPMDEDAIAQLLSSVGTAFDEFRILQVTDLTGRVLATTSGVEGVDPAESEWFQQLAAGQSVLTSPVERNGAIEWVAAEPVLGADGRPQGAVIGYLDISALATLLNPDLGRDVNVMVLDPSGLLIYDTNMGAITDDATLLSAGALGTTVNNEVTRDASGAGGSVGEYDDREGRRVVGAADVVDGLGWVLVAQEHTSHSQAPLRDQRRLAVTIGIIGIIVAALAAWIFARREARKLTAFAEETRVAGVDVNSAASELSSASEELASTTTEQSAAVTEASATTEELARASSVIADTVDEVARQAAETRDNLEQAEADIQASSERTVELANRVNDIGALLALINEIADQTGLLALNAAIEAARAGEDGRGFAVVADEVRRLADNSKSSAADIARIIEAVQTETNATVMAMEKGAKQMQQGLALLEHVTDATDQVRLTTQQQRSATAQVVETMEQLTDASRQVSMTAQQIASAAGNLAHLAGQLDATATAAKDRY